MCQWHRKVTFTNQFPPKAIAGSFPISNGLISLQCIQQNGAWIWVNHSQATTLDWQQGHTHITMQGTAAARSQPGTNHKHKVAREKADQRLEKERQCSAQRRSGSAGEPCRGCSGSGGSGSAEPGLNLAASSVRSAPADGKVPRSPGFRQTRTAARDVQKERNSHSRGKGKRLFHEPSLAWCGGCSKPTRQIPTDTRAGGELRYALSLI